MKTSELINELTQYIAVHGDLPVMIEGSCENFDLHTEAKHINYVEDLVDGSDRAFISIRNSKWGYDDAAKAHDRRIRDAERKEFAAIVRSIPENDARWTRKWWLDNHPELLRRHNQDIQYFIDSRGEMWRNVGNSGGH